MKTKVVRVYEEDIEKLKAMGNSADVIHELLQKCNTSVTPTVTPSVTPSVTPQILHAEKIVLGPPMTGLTPADVDKIIAKNNEKVRNIVTNIMDKYFDSPLTESSLPEGTRDWLVPAKAEDMIPVAKDMMKKMKEE